MAAKHFLPAHPEPHQQHQQKQQNELHAKQKRTSTVLPLSLTLVCLLLALPGVGGVVDGGCPPDPSPCPGDRPRLPSGCCPGGGGEACGPESGRPDCDVQLGFRCLDPAGNVSLSHGLCTGVFNVTVTDIQTDRLSLTWQDFKPPDYSFEYVLLYRQGQFNPNMSTWELLDIGTRADYTLTKLQAASLYFLRLAIWADSEATLLGSFSEAVWVSTQSVERCMYDGQEFLVGAVTTNCEDNCTCLNTGNMDCVSRCPLSELPELPEGCSLVYADECSCNTTVHCPDSDAPCEFDGREYEAGSTVTLGCRSCHCTRGTMTCTYPEECEVREATEECPHPTATDTGQEDCCPTWTCGNEPTLTTTTEGSLGCDYNGTLHAEGSHWVDNGQCSNCTCHSGEVRCRALCQAPAPPPGCLSPTLRPSESGCCQEVVCQSAGECHHNDTTYGVGDMFTDRCSLCMCLADNNVSCSFLDCPTIHLPIPSMLCPFPHVKRDGCCHTVYCMDDTVDAETLMRRLMAISFGPTTLTVSFDVDHGGDTSSGDTVTQDRYEIMTSDRGGDVHSWNSRTFTATRIDVDDNVSSPMDLLHADSAIQVDDRVFITLDGLRPNTTYYVRVQPVIKRDMGVTDSADNVTLVGIIMVQTMPTDGSCQVGEDKYQDGDVVSQTCEEMCTCTAGHVTCENACPDEKVVPVPSSTCPLPVLDAPEEGSCCRTWRCLSADEDCSHNGLILKNGEQVYEGSCDRKCRCTDGEVTCTPVCPPVSPAPRAKCVLTNMTGSCCPVWMCPRETRPPVQISLAGRVGFRGICVDHDSFKASLKSAVIDRLQGHLPCADRESSFFAACVISDVRVTCPPSDVYRRRRQTSDIYALIVITANITDWNPARRVQESLEATQRAVTALFTDTAVRLLLDTGHNVTASGAVHSLGTTFVCDPGFSYTYHSCVSDYRLPRPVPTQRHNVSMSVVNVSHSSATLVWPHLPPPVLSYVIGLVVEYRQATAHAWNRSVTLLPAAMSFTVTYLLPSRPYVVRLVALTNSSSALRISLSLVEFRTTEHQVLTGPLTLEPLHFSLGLTTATLRWPRLDSHVVAAIQRLGISYRPSQDVDLVTDIDLNPRDSHVTLTGLSPGTAYVSKFKVVLVNGTTFTTMPVHFVTMVEDSPDKALVPLLVTCAVIVLLSVLLPVAFIVWRRARRKTHLGTAFENKAYGLNIASLCTTRAKNDAAQRPQDQTTTGGGGGGTGGSGGDEPPRGDEEDPEVAAVCVSATSTPCPPGVGRSQA